MTVREALGWVRRYSGLTEMSASDAYIYLFLKESFAVTSARLAARLAGRMVSWFTVDYPAGADFLDLTTLSGYPKGHVVVVHVGISSSDGRHTVETLDPADERDFGPVLSVDYRKDTYSSFRWRFADGLLKIYPAPGAPLRLRVGLSGAPQFPSDEDATLFDFLGPSLSVLAARAAVLLAARDLKVVYGDDPAPLMALLAETWNEVETLSRGQVASTEPVPGVAWRDG
ncbi:MAG: hypothetical protein QXS54_10435 [Candidatus Methanomethylicaceae archaeon]